MLALVLCFLRLNAFCQSPFDFSEFEFSSEGVLYLSPTDSLLGHIEYSELYSKKVSFSENQDKFKKYLAKDVIGFRLNEPSKEYISVKSDGVDRSILFYENTTPQNIDLCLIQYFLAETGPLGIIIEGGKPKGEWTTSVYSKKSKMILPSGNKKLAEALKDCPELSKKVAKKEKGYSVGLIALPGAKNELNRRIVEEYNSCE